MGEGCSREFQALPLALGYLQAGQAFAISAYNFTVSLPVAQVMAPPDSGCRSSEPYYPVSLRQCGGRMPEICAYIAKCKQVRSVSRVQGFGRDQAAGGHLVSKGVAAAAAAFALHHASRHERAQCLGSVGAVTQLRPGPTSALPFSLSTSPRLPSHFTYGII